MTFGACFPPLSLISLVSGGSKIFVSFAELADWLWGHIRPLTQRVPGPFMPDGFSTVPFRAVQHAYTPSSNLLAKQLQNVAEILARLCCHLLTSSEGGGLTIYPTPALFNAG